MKTNSIMTIIKGIVVGGTMLVPGVSGGSMAIILGIYNQLVSAVSSFRKNKKESFIFLILFSIGGGAGVLILAKPILYLIEQYPMPMLYLFLGAVAGGVPLILKQAEVKGFSVKILFYIALGIVIVLMMSMMPREVLQAEKDMGAIYYVILLLAGVIAAVALILPGISVSYLLLTMGLYDQTIKAISGFNLSFLIPLGVGVILGIILTTKILENIMNKYPQPTYLIILGFVLGSMIEVFPGIPSRKGIVLCLMMFISGFFAICRLSWKNDEKAA